MGVASSSKIGTAAPTGEPAARGATLAELETLYRLRYRDFVRTAAAIAGSVESGGDAVHDAFVSLVRNRGRYSGAGTLEAWAWRAVVNAARKQRRGSRVFGLHHHAGVAEAEPAPEAHPRLRRAVARLPRRQQTAVFLRYFAGLDYATIADVMGTRVGTVGAALNAAHASLRKSLEEEQE
jgi:RNA polymerase sigma-70 factor (ECF subfamily)